MVTDLRENECNWACGLDMLDFKFDIYVTLGESGICCIIKGSVTKGFVVVAVESHSRFAYYKNWLLQ